MINPVLSFYNKYTAIVELYLPAPVGFISWFIISMFFCVGWGTVTCYLRKSALSKRLCNISGNFD